MTASGKRCGEGRKLHQVDDVDERLTEKPECIMDLLDLITMLAGRARLAEAEGQPERVVVLRQLAVKGVTQYLAAHPADLPEWKRLLGLLAPRAPAPPIQIDPRVGRGLVM